MTIVSTGQLTLTDLNDNKQLILYLNANYRTQVYDPLSTTHTPNFTSTNLVITPELFVAGGGGANLLPSTQVQSLTWYEGTQTATPIAESATNATTTAGYTYTLPTGAVGTTAKPLTIKSNLTTPTQIYTCVIVYRDPDTLFDTTVKAQFEIIKINNGAKGDVGTNAVTAFITNSAVTLPATNAGAVSVFTGSGTDIYVYDGTTPLAYVSSAPANGQFTVTTGISPASGVTLGTITAGSSPNRAIVPNITAMATANDVVTVTYTISGKTSIGTAINATAMQTFSKSKAGMDGTTPTSYWLVTSSDVIQKNVAGTTSPATLTITGFSQVGTSAPSSTASFKFVTDTSTDGSTFTNNVASPTGAVASTTFTTSFTNLKAVRFRLYRSVDTPTVSNFIDEQIVMVVSDGATGIDSYYLNVWTPDGDTVRNSSGSLKIQADLYKGAGTVTPTAFKWYVQDSTATTASGGDADGGNGWRLINGVADATTAPTLALVPNTSTRLTAQTYFVRYTWLGLSGETLSSAEASLAVTANNDLRITIPTFVTNAVGAKVYIGTVTGATNLKYQGEITTSGGNILLTKYDATTSAPPVATSASTAVVTSASITVVPEAIAGIEGFQCVATAPVTGTKYKSVTVVKDFQDPISVNVLGANVLKNGQGSVVLQAQLIQNGVEISTAGYLFSWALYNQNGSLNKTLSGVTDTITVLASDFNGVNNLVVEVSK